MKPVDILKLTIKTVLIILVSAVLGYLLLMGSFCIPDGRIQQNTEISAEQFHEAMLKSGELQERFPNWSLQQDFFEDEIILMQAAYYGNEPVLEKVNMIYYYMIDSVGNPGSLWEHYANGVKFDVRNEYLRYWHGYIIVLRPLLNFFDYNSIIIINAVCQILLTALFLYLLWRKGYRDVILPYLIGYGILMPVITWRTLQYSSCLYVMLFACIMLAAFDKRMKSMAPYLFLMTGILLAYFDLLTYPVLTLAVPMALYLRICVDDNRMDNLRNIIINSVMWGVGYIGMWFCKGVMMAAVTRSTKVFNVLIDNVKFRMSNSTEDGGGGSFSVAQMLYLNLRRFINSPFIIVAVIFLAYCLVRCLIGMRKGNIKLKESVLILLLFMLIAFMPFAWYIVTVNHSSVHCWYTNKAMVSSVFAACLGMSYLAHPGRRP